MDRHIDTEASTDARAASPALRQRGLDPGGAHVGGMTSPRLYELLLWIGCIRIALAVIGFALGQS